MRKIDGMLLIDVGLLKTGAILAGDVYDGHTILLRKGTRVTKEFLDGLKLRNVTHVSVTRAVADEIDSQSPPSDPAPELKEPMRSMELRQSAYPEADKLGEYRETEKKLYKAAEVETCVDLELMDEVSLCVEDVFSRMTDGASLNTDALRVYMKDMISQTLARPNAAVKLIDVGQYDKYTFQHSVNVGLLFIIVGRDFIPSDLFEEIALGAVLHDIGKTRVPWELISKPGKLTDEEFEIVKRHPVESERILREHGGFGKEALEIAYLHHEKWNGTGYPLGLDARSLSIYAQTSAVCDVYDALTTSRSYKQKMDFYTAMGIIVRGAGSHFSPSSVNLLSRKLGLFPVGSFVLLSTREAAIVCEIAPNDLMRPKVKVMFDKDNKPFLHPSSIDLAQATDIRIVRSLTTADMMQLSVKEGISVV